MPHLDSTTPDLSVSAILKKYRKARGEGVSPEVVLERLRVKEDVAQKRSQSRQELLSGLSDFSVRLAREFDAMKFAQAGGFEGNIWDWMFKTPARRQQFFIERAGTQDLGE